MKLTRLAYHYKVWGWQLNPVELTDLNLLLGASSVGKTQIIKAILDLKCLANGESPNGVAWEVEFTINDEIYRWLGETETVDPSSFSMAEIHLRPKILREQLFRGEQNLFERDRGVIYFQGVALPIKLPTRESLISLLQEDNHVAPIHSSFNKVVYKIEQVSQFTNTEWVHLDLAAEAYQTWAGLQGCDLPIYVKLAVAYHHLPDVFNEIKARFIELFPHVAEVKVDILTKNSHVAPSLYLREHGMTNWMPSSRISAGMLKSLIFIANLYLCDEGSVILIDEFENGLGVNCIDILSDMLIQDRDLQLIITSHHPYIINNVPMIYWKIVTRKGDIVTVKTAAELHLGDSKHEAFMQLLQLEEFTDGIINA